MYVIKRDHFKALMSTIILQKQTLINTQFGYAAFLGHHKLFN